MSGKADPAKVMLGEQALLTAAKVIEWRRALTKAPFPHLPEAAILTHQRFLLPRRRLWLRGQGQRCFSFDIRPVAHGTITLAGIRGVGAPATAVAIEELFVAGVRKLLVVDVAGSIDARVLSGEIVIVDSAIAGDGTSPHYAPGPSVSPNESLGRQIGDRLSKAGIAFSTGVVWSTDAIYREIPSQIIEARRQGAVLADMETACVFAVSATLGLQAAAVLVVADELHDGWRAPVDLRLNKPNCAEPWRQASLVFGRDARDRCSRIRKAGRPAATPVVPRKRLLSA